MPNWFEEGFHDGNYNVARGNQTHKTLFNEGIGLSPLSVLRSSSQVEWHIAGGREDSGISAFDIVFAIDGMMSQGVVHIDAESKQDATKFCHGLAIGLLHRAANVRRNHKLVAQMHDHLAYMRT